MRWNAQTIPVRQADEGHRPNRPPRPVRFRRAAAARFAGQGTYFLTRNAARGDNWYLDGMDGAAPALMRSAGSTPPLSQRWVWGGNSAPFAGFCTFVYTLQSGQAKSLANINNVAWMQATAPIVGQCFGLHRESRR